DQLFRVRPLLIFESHAEVVGHVVQRASFRRNVAHPILQSTVPHCSRAPFFHIGGSFSRRTIRSVCVHETSVVELSPARPSRARTTPAPRSAAGAFGAGGTGAVFSAGL